MSSEISQISSTAIFRYVFEPCEQKTDSDRLQHFYLSVSLRTRSTRWNVHKFKQNSLHAALKLGDLKSRDFPPKWAHLQIVTLQLNSKMQRVGVNRYLFRNYHKSIGTMHHQMLALLIASIAQIASWFRRMARSMSKCPMPDGFLPTNLFALCSRSLLLLWYYYLVAIARYVSHVVTKRKQRWARVSEYRPQINQMPVRHRNSNHVWIASAMLQPHANKPRQLQVGYQRSDRVTPVT